MNEPRPTVTFRVSVPSLASREAVYGLLANVATHLDWAGTDASRSDFRLLSIDASDRPAGVGDRFSSTGASMNGTFHDRSTVTEAEPGVRFGFDTESTLDRRHGTTWRAHVAHRYAIDDVGEGVTITYTCEIRPQNYVPYWWKPAMRPMTRFMVRRFTHRNLENLAEAARAVSSEPAGG